MLLKSRYIEGSFDLEKMNITMHGIEFLQFNCTMEKCKKFSERIKRICTGAVITADKPSLSKVAVFYYPKTNKS